MKTFTNARPRDIDQAVKLSADARKSNKAVSFAGGGSDLLALVKDRIIAPDLIVGLRTIKDFDRIASTARGLTIGGGATLESIASNAAIKRDYAVLAEAADSVATPQIRNVGTIAGNIAQRPWCWYYRNGFPCYKAGGKQCFSVAGDNRFHAIFGGGPSYIVHPSDTAPALVALGASITIHGPSGERTIPAADFFQLPRQDASRENVLGPDDVIASIGIPAPKPGTRSTYHKLLDREAWTHAVVSAAIVLEMDGATCTRASIVLGGVAPVPWRLPEVEKMLAGQRISEELAMKAGEQAVVGARPMSKNGYKVLLTKNLVSRVLLEIPARA